MGSKEAAAILKIVISMGVYYALLSYLHLPGNIILEVFRHKSIPPTTEGAGPTAEARTTGMTGSSLMHDHVIDDSTQGSLGSVVDEVLSTYHTFDNRLPSYTSSSDSLVEEHTPTSQKLSSSGREEIAS